MGTRHKQRQTQALPSAIVGDDQDGNPSRDDGQVGQPRAQIEPLLPPVLIFLTALVQRVAALLAQSFPACRSRLPCAAAVVALRLASRPLRLDLRLMVLTQRLPSPIFLAAALPEATSVGA